MNGIIIPSGGGLNQIIANDLSCSVSANNGGIVDLNTSSMFNINSIPSSQYFIVYGQSKGENETSQ